MLSDELVVRSEKDDVVDGQKLYLDSYEPVYPLRTHHNKKGELIAISCLKYELDGMKMVRVYKMNRFPKCVILHVER